MSRPLGPLLLAASLALSAPLAGAAAAQCLLCAPDADSAAPSAAVPLSIEVDASLDFPRAAVGRGGGRITLDPSGATRVSGEVTALASLAMHGRVLVRGEPGRAVRVTLPERVTLRTPEGAEADLTDLQSDLPGVARIGADGTLRFQFGGALSVGGGADGDYRGRIPITVDYL